MIRTPSVRGWFAALAGMWLIAFTHWVPADSVAPAASPIYEVSQFEFAYAYDRPGQPTLGPVAGLVVELSDIDGVLTAPRPGARQIKLKLSDITPQSPRRFEWSGIEAICRQVVGYYNHLGYAGVQVGPSPSAIEVAVDPATGAPVGGKDLRPKGDTKLQLLVRLATISSVRSLVTPVGAEAPRIDAPQDRRIIRLSPLKGPSDGSPGSLLRKDVLDDYIYRLDRQPGRHVDAAISPGTDVTQGDVTLDYLVTEFKPWQIYIQGSNTGTRDTGMWRERAGFIDNELTGHDDILSLDYTTAGFSGYDAFVGTYEAPFPNTDRLRWRLHGLWDEFSASDVALVSAGRGRQEGGGADLVFNFLQCHDLFLDLVGGAQWEHINAGGGQSNLFLPHVGLSLEQNAVIHSTVASVDIAHNFAGVADTQTSEIDKFGRMDVNRTFSLLTAGVTHSFYLEPLFSHASDTSTAGTSSWPHLAHELYFAAHGQYAFDHRLIPEEEGLVGGFYTVRGYREVLAAGDDVVYGTAEYRYHIPRGFNIQPSPQKLFGQPFRYAPQQPYGPADWDLIFRAFIDAGETWNNKRAAGELGQTLVGSGVGLELLVKNNLDIRVDYGIALHRADQTQVGDSRVHFVGTLSY